MTTARRRSRRTRHHPVSLAAGLLALLLLLALGHAIGWLVLTAAIAAGAYALGQRRRGQAPPRTVIVPDASPRLAEAEAERDQLRGQLARVTAERDQLGAAAADLRRQLAEATDAAHAAWDAAASITPRPPVTPPDTGGQRAALLADPLSGARPLVGR
jgi:hypothetical protein